MFLIIGLGNPGKKYEKTRHNIGFRALAELNQKLGASDFRLNQKLNGKISKTSYAGEEVILLQPQTFMNLSGKSVQATQAYFHVELKKIIVMHDDSDIAFGKIKVQTKRNSAGHNGIESIIASLGTNSFTRVRIGVRPDNQQVQLKASDFVLKNFSPEEESVLPEMIKLAASLCLEAMKKQL